MERVLLCEDCIVAIQSRGIDVYVGKAVERWMYEDEGNEFKCGFCGDDWLYGDDHEEDDELYECVW